MSHETMYIFKIILVGDTGVGKTSLLYQLTENKWSERLGITIGIDYSSKIIVSNGKKVKLNIWDTAGQEKYRSLTKSYYRGADMALLVYDITNRKSFKSVENWILDIRETKSMPLMIVANKTDLSDKKREVGYQEGSQLAKRFNSLFWETSAKCLESTECVFSLITKQLIEYSEQEILPISHTDLNEPLIRFKKQSHPKSKCC